MGGAIDVDQPEVVEGCPVGAGGILDKDLLCILVCPVQSFFRMVLGDFLVDPLLRLGGWITLGVVEVPSLVWRWNLRGALGCAPAWTVRRAPSGCRGLCLFSSQVCHSAAPGCHLGK